jgi:hypothetical protein
MRVNKTQTHIGVCIVCGRKGSMIKDIEEIYICSTYCLYKYKEKHNGQLPKKFRRGSN